MEEISNQKQSFKEIIEIFGNDGKIDSWKNLAIRLYETLKDKAQQEEMQTDYFCPYCGNPIFNKGSEYWCNGGDCSFNPIVDISDYLKLNHLPVFTEKPHEIELIDR